MITVEEAQQRLLREIRDYGEEDVPLLKACGRVLARDVHADRDLPPYDRVTMDGIAIRFDDVAQGIRSFPVVRTMAAGDVPEEINAQRVCVEIMTGCALPTGLDTVVRYEDVTIENATAILNTLPSRRGANVHPRASDKRRGEVVIQRGHIIGPSHISMLASVGVSLVPVRRLPRVAVISTGDELVEVNEMPLPQQVRRSNTWAIASVLESVGAVVEMKHLRDDAAEVQSVIKVLMDDCDVLVLSGGVSMGKYDVIPEVLKSLGFSEVFHKVRQRPGKPFWFGTHSGKNTVVFAFPGNPVSSFLCLYRYFLPWLRASSGAKATGGLFAALAEDVTFAPELQYFVPVKLVPAGDGAIRAMPLAGNGSGDFSVLIDADGFMELPAGRSEFRTGDVFPVWLFNNNIF